MKADLWVIKDDPDLTIALAALKRAGQMARKIAIQTNTEVIVLRDGVITHISAEELRNSEPPEEPEIRQASPTLTEPERRHNCEILPIATSPTRSPDQTSS